MRTELEELPHSLLCPYAGDGQRTNKDITSTLSQDSLMDWHIKVDPVTAAKFDARKCTNA
jgi:hypothetical protein